MRNEGRYRPVRRLGTGGTGTVYAAADTLLGRTVALKQLNGSVDTDLLRREAHSLACLTHPNVVTLHDLVEEGEHPYLVLEYVEGTNLGAWLDQRGVPALDNGLALFVQVARAVEHAHALGVLHCDIKPSNVLISTAGEVKLTDFTLAHHMTRGRFHGPRGGSLEYAAPEQLAGSGEVDERTDVYALGVLLRRLTAGRLADTPEGDVVQAAVGRATQPEPVDRFASVRELLDGLPPSVDATRLAGTPRPSSEHTRVLPGQSRRRSRPRLFGAVAMAAAGGAAAVVVVFAGWTMFASASPATVRLPDMVASNASSAKLVAGSLALRSTVRRVYSAAAPAGAVIAQQPRAGTNLPEHGMVTLIVSKGPKPLAVPAVGNLHQGDAVAKLRHAGFKVVIHTRDTVFQPAGTVLDQSPGATTQKLPGATVTITVSTKPWWWIF
jgi:eukaryotic-like serine/threonine-protein kinase